ncbi:MAG: hypothetical protein KY468_01405 [Armatimonadetes bacterium]|nr:hypothetical protein [Armatimonadota bacterium]
MQTTLAAVAAIGALVGMAFALAVRRGHLRQDEGTPYGHTKTLAVFIALGAVALALLTFLEMKPLSSGNTLGWGFLLGAALGLFTLYLSATAADDFWLPDSVGLLAAAVFGPAALLYLFRADPAAALGGGALGAAFAGCMARSLSPLVSARTPVGETAAGRPAYAGMEPFVLAAATLFAAARLGMERFPRNAPNDPAGAYWIAPAVLLAAGALALSLLPGRRGGGIPLLFGAIVGAVAVGGAALLHARALPDLAWITPLFGLVGFGLLLLFLWQEPPAETGEDARPVTPALGALFLTLAVLALAFQRQQAYGQALALVTAALVVTPVGLSRNRWREALPGALGIGAWSFALLLVLYRVFVEGAGRGRPLDFQNHYDVAALLLGLCGTFALLAFAHSDAEREHDSAASPLRFLPRTLLLGFGVTAAPLAIATAWGVRATGAFLIGLPFAAAAWMLLAAWSAGEERRKTLAATPHLYLVASALVAIQLAPFVLALELTRVQRLGVVGALALVALVVILASSARREPPVPKETRDEIPV